MTTALLQLAVYDHLRKRRAFDPAAGSHSPVRKTQGSVPQDAQPPLPLSRYSVVISCVCFSLCSWSRSRHRLAHSDTAQRCSEKSPRTALNCTCDLLNDAPSEKWPHRPKARGEGQSGSNVVTLHADTVHMKALLSDALFGLGRDNS
ncbi:hypothetical protein BCV70DRAFT_202773 [Testicularia cyperi]|uniref:Uncharacterized protein n=1 Tax=Testicularia cyperi TaxID=1882483 RepID=A0A317XJ03_9BASI|nr:hypothetical protein BCV70DRAFT_202773 [Testicularia cyperi]